MSHYFTNDEIKSNEKNIYVLIKNQKLEFTIDNGVFSKKGLDFGTRSLLENIDIDNISGDVLDLGCGYGPIGIFLKKTTDCNVDMCDINERAVYLAKKNSINNNVDVNVFVSDSFKNINKKYNYIVTNPPIRIGKEKLYEMLSQALNHLKKDGKVYIVINKNQGAKTLMKDFDLKSKTTLIKKNKGFYIISIQNR